MKSKMEEEELKSMCRINGTIKLSSGGYSKEYYNLKDLYCQKREVVLDYFYEMIERDLFDCLVSIELGGALIASGLAERMNVGLAIYRKQRPSLGKPHGECVIMDDVSTTGNSIKILEKWCKDCGAEVIQTVIGIDRRPNLK